MSANALKTKRAKVKAAITRASAFAASMQEDVSPEELQVRLHNLNEDWNQLKTTEDSLCQVEGENADDIVAFGQYEEKYFQTSAIFVRALNSKVKQQQVAEVDTAAASQSSILEGLQRILPPKSDVALPKIVIPPFSGEYEAWQSFRDIFIGSIGVKKELTKAQKFYYLVSFLTGEAAHLLRNIPITEDNYDEAWEKLEERYDRPHLIARSCIKNFMKLPSITTASPKALRKIIDGADESIRGLSAININERDPWLIYILLTKLDADTQQAWFAETESLANPTIDEFLKFLDKRFIHLESTELLATGSKQTTVRSHTVETNSNSCLVCSETHVLSKCPVFGATLEGDRRKFVMDKSLCFRCLKSGHQARNCKSTQRCQHCNATHHSLVHKTQQNQNAINNNATADCIEQSSTSSCAAHMECVCQGATVASNLVSSFNTNVRSVMPTAVVCGKEKTDKIVKLRILLDTGSEVSLMTESCAQLIGATRFNARLGVRGIGSSDAGDTKGLTHVELFSCIDNSSVQVTAYILPKVTSHVPARYIDIGACKKLKALNLADSSFNISAPIDMLLGADIVWSILRNGRVPIVEPNLLAVNTIFGWVISGQFSESSEGDMVASYSTTIDIDKLLTRFWELSECKPMPSQSNHDDPAEIHFRETHSRLADGRYRVELPFKTSYPEFGDTLFGALQRLHAMERRFARNADLKQEYAKFIDEYVNLGHMSVISQNEIENTPNYYLPHHAVFKPDSSTTKLRVVFDGSHKDSSGKSLNDELMIGPPIQRDLFGVSLRFREHLFVFTADITKMFRQIWLTTHHQDYQRIVWRNSTEEPVKHFRLRTVTYGTASAPFHSVRVLQQLAMDNYDQYPRAAEVILKNIYVDDVMVGGESANDLFVLKSELVELLDSGGFKLRKWYSNSKYFLETIPSEDRERLIEDDGEGDCIKILGLYWNPELDTYSFHVNTSSVTNVTKRHILSEIARIFDIFGFLAPVVVKLKILLQNVWQLKVDWDASLPKSIVTEWSKICENIRLLQNVNIPRQIYMKLSNCEIHIFCDASTDAYAAVVYSVLRTSSGTTVRLVAAKTRVAPLRAVSVPRLELCAALLGAHLYNSIRASLEIDTSNVFAWTDSQLVIHYLSAPPRKWKMFVSNRCEEILDILPRTRWAHVKTNENPADCASRGIYPEELLSHKLWFTGPDWLAKNPSKWPMSKTPSTNEISEELLELRAVKACTTDTIKNNSICMQLLKRHSSFSKVTRIVAYTLRAIARFRKQKEICTFLTHTELYNARMKLFACIQQEFFSKIIAALKQRSLPKKDPLLKLSPFLDSSDVLRVGGRIRDASISFEAKHPVILPKCDVTANIIRELHERYLHAGAAHLFFLLRQQFWVIGARNLVRKIVHNCRRCFMQRKKTSAQYMADLPAVRIQPARPFLNSGCDFAGPITIKMTNCKKPRICKSYICLFICLSTKAIHIELATDLTAEAFISAYIRFTARRGRCANLYSDNGTNFHGANRLMTEMHKLLLDEARTKEIHTLLANDGTTWHFIPPSSPHFGGIWESNIKCIKLHMNRVIGDQLLSYDEMYTVLTQIEALLNSRPLCYASDSEINPITPSHFLIGETLASVPVPVEQPANCSYASHFNWLRNMVQGFWKRWHLEYLSTLQPRAKWAQNQRNYEIGDVVVLKEPNMPPSKWLLGKIIETHPGADGRTRVVTIKTEHAVYKRPVVKIALLPCV